MKKITLTIVLIVLIIHECTSLLVTNVSYYNQAFSEKVLYHHIILTGIKYPDIVLAQAKLESGHFTSIVFKENNNLFGMRMPKVRETTAIGENRRYSVYKNWRDSVEDYKLWQDKMIHKTNTESEYLCYLENHYAQDPKYTSYLKQLK